MANILVTGANGQLGSEIRTLAAAQPQHRFLFNDRDEVDITDAQQVDACFAGFRPEYCINCAAYTAVDKAETDLDTAHAINATAVQLLAAACTRYHTKFIHISTDYVFDGQGTKPYGEDHPTAPVSVYGKTKMQGEQEAVRANRDVIIIRTSWVYSEYGHNFVKTMLRLMQSKPELGVVADQWGSPTYAADLAEAILQIINSGTWVPGIYHYSNAGAITWYHFAQAISELSHLPCTVKAITTADYPTPATRPAYAVMDTQKIQKVYGIALKDWKESLRNCLQKLQQGAQAS
jgi:dTDP-4-dehydrorhamnose reductase